MDSNKVANSAKALLQTTALLFFVCLALQIPLVAKYGHHWLIWANLVIHLLAALCVVGLCQMDHPIWARSLLLICYYSYVVCATLVWQKDVYIQHFLLIGSLCCVFLFTNGEHRARLCWGIIYSITFCLLDIRLSFALPGWEGAIRRGNSITLAIASTSVVIALYYHTGRRWRNLSTNYRATREVLFKLTPAAKFITTTNSLNRQKIAFACVLFADIKGYQKLTAMFEESNVIDSLDGFYTHLDIQAKQLNMLPVKTNGDEYMAVSALTQQEATDEMLIANSIAFALAALSTFTAFAAEHRWPCQIRIGLAAGPVTAGMPKRRHGTFDVWGNTVNTASMMEHAALPNSIVVSSSVYDQATPQLKQLFTPAVVNTKLGDCSVFRYLAMTNDNLLSPYASDLDANKTGTLTRDQ